MSLSFYFWFCILQVTIQTWFTIESLQDWFRVLGLSESCGWVVRTFWNWMRLYVELCTGWTEPSSTLFYPTYVHWELIVIMILRRNIIGSKSQLKQLVAYLILYVQSIVINLATYVDEFHCFAYKQVYVPYVLWI